MTTKFKRMDDVELRMYHEAYPLLKRSVEESMELLDELLTRILLRQEFIEQKILSIESLLKKP